MDDYKKQCQSRHKNKGRYKDKSKIVPKTTPKETKPSLDSNWDRYEGKIVDEPPAPQTFSLKNEVVAHGGAFVLKSDRYRLTDGERWQPDDMFRLDVDAIAAAVRRVPFYERVAIDRALFTDDEIAAMELDSSPSTFPHECYGSKTTEVVAPKEPTKDELERDLEDWLEGVLS